MSTEMFYTEANKIPAFRIIYADDGVTYVEFYNPRTGARDKIRAADFIYQLLQKIA